MKQILKALQIKSVKYLEMNGSLVSFSCEFHAGICPFIGMLSKTHKLFHLLTLKDFWEASPAPCNNFSAFLGLELLKILSELLLTFK